MVVHQTPQSHWATGPTGATALQDPRLGPYCIPELACCFIPALPCSPRFLRCWPPSRTGNARKKPNLCFDSAGWVRRVFQVKSVKVKVGSGNPSIPRESSPPQPQTSCRPVRASEMTPVHIGTVEEGREKKKSPPSVAVAVYRCGSFPSCAVII